MNTRSSELQENNCTKTSGVLNKPTEGEPLRVFFINKSLADSKSSIDLIALRNPGSEEKSLYILDKEGKQIYELVKESDPYRCWFVNDYVSADGNIYMTLPMNAGFFVIYYLRKYCMDKAVPWDQIYDDEYPDSKDLLQYFCDSTLDVIADRKGPSELKAYKYNPKRTLAWLTVMIRRVANQLKETNINVRISAISENYIKCEKSMDSYEEDYMRYAFGIVSNYITMDLEEELKTHLKIKDEKDIKRPLLKYEIPEAKKIKLEESFLSPKAEVSKDKKTSTKEKALAKAASGSKSIASFFKK